MGVRGFWSRLEAWLGWADTGSPHWTGRCLRAVSRSYVAVAIAFFSGAAFSWALVVLDAVTTRGTFVLPGAISAGGLTVIALAVVRARRPAASALKRWRRGGPEALSEDERAQLARIRDRFEGTDWWGGALADGHLDAWVGWGALLALSVGMMGVVWSLMVWTVVRGQVRLEWVGLVALATALPALLILRVWKDLGWNR